MAHNFISFPDATRSLVDTAVSTQNVSATEVLSNRDLSLVLFKEAHPYLSLARHYESLPPKLIKDIDLTNISDEKFQPRIVFEPKSKEWQVWFDDGVTGQESLGGATQFRANLLAMVEGFRALDQDLGQFHVSESDKFNELPVFYAIFKSVDDKKGGTTQVIDPDQSRTFLFNRSQYANLHRQLETFLDPPSLEAAKPQM